MRLRHEQLRLFPIQHQRDGYVYALLMPSRAIKIGWTGRSPRRRAAEMGGELLGYVSGSLVDEAYYHQQLAAYRIGRTEDFWPASAVWDLVYEFNGHRAESRSPPAAS